MQIRRFPVFLIVVFLLLWMPCALAHDVTYIGDPEVDSSFMTKWASPVSGEYTITGAYGEQRSNHIHQGLDIQPTPYENAIGAPVFAVANGVVSICTDDLSNRFFGWVVIDHGGGYETWYGDLDGVDGQWGGHPLKVRFGQRVYKGQVIGYMMGDGEYDIGGAYSSGPHVHFEVRQYGRSLSPMEYAGFGDWIAGDPSSYQVQSGSADFRFDTDAFIKFLDPIRKAIDQIATICVKGQHILVNIIQWVLITLIIIDFSLSAILATIDKNVWSGSGKNSFLGWLVMKFLLYAVLTYLLTHWAGFVANMARELFMNAGAAISGASYDSVEKNVVDPFGIVATGAKLCEPLFHVLASNNSEWVHVPIIGPFVGLAHALPPLITIFVIMLSFFLIALQVAYAYIGFYMVILFSFVNFMFAGTKQTRKYAENGMNAVFTASLHLFFWCFFVMCLSNSLYTIQVKDLTHVEDASYMTNGNFNSVSGVLYAIGTVESGHTPDVYNNHDPRGGHAAYGTYQIMPEYYDESWVKNWNDKEGHLSDADLLAYSLVNDPPNSPHNYGVTYYGWNPELQEKVAYCRAKEYAGPNGDYRNVATRWYGVKSDEYWEKVCQAGGGRRNIETMNINVAFQIILICLVFVIMGDKLSQRILKVFGGGNGFRFIN